MQSSEVENSNPVGIKGLAFLEFGTHDPTALDVLFTDLGFIRSAQSYKPLAGIYRQNEIYWIVNEEKKSFSHSFAAAHGPGISAMGLMVHNAWQAKEMAVARGARVSPPGDYRTRDGKLVPSVYGIGESLIYFIDKEPEAAFADMGFTPLPGIRDFTGHGFLRMDHLTNNVPRGTLRQWSDFYKSVFGFTDVRHFDITGKQTGLLSYALRSPCGTFCIPINEAKDEKSQIAEYLRAYRGAGIQHVAILTENILDSVRQSRERNIQMLDVEPDYYQTVFEKVPNITEDRKKLRQLGILIDGDEKGYLLQIFTQNVIGPIFFEFIQRKNHQSFGEGNFGALFRSIEKDQERRGVL